MGILKDNKKNQIRYECEEVILYEPDSVQLEELRNVIIENTDVNILTGEAETTYGYDIIRYVFKFYTTIGDEIDGLDDDELEELIENKGEYNHKIQGLVRAVKELLREITEQFLYEALEAIRNLNEQLNVVKLNQETSKLENTFNEVAEGNNSDVKFEDIINIVKEKEILKKEIENKEE